MDPNERIKKPLIRQAGSAVSLCWFYSRWLRTELNLARSSVFSSVSPKRQPAGGPPHD